MGRPTIHPGTRAKEKAGREGEFGSAALSPLTFDINVFVGGLRPGSKQLIHPLNPPLVFVHTGMQFSRPSNPFFTPPSARPPSRLPCSLPFSLSLSLSLSLSRFLSLLRPATCATWAKRERIHVTPLRGCLYNNPVT